MAARLGIIVTLVLVAAPTVRAGDRVARFNRGLCGQVIDHSRNCGRDNRIYSEILGECRDMYVYLPPGYDPSRSYPLLVWLHGAFGDEHAFLYGGTLEYLDQLIASGCATPVIIACPDGTYGGTNRIWEEHSYYINGLGGRFEDHVMQEVLPFLLQNYSIRPEREAHAIAGLSAGGVGAMVIAIKHRSFFAIVATMGAPVNLRYYNCMGKYRENFSPQTYCLRNEYRPKEVVGIYFSGLVKLRARQLVEHAFGPREQLLINAAQQNPAELIFTQDLQPGELQIYLNYAGRDNFNFDAHAESFYWLAQSKGIQVEMVCDPKAHHSVSYFRRSQKQLYRWVCDRVLPPTEGALPSQPNMQPVPRQ